MQEHFYNYSRKNRLSMRATCWVDMQHAWRGMRNAYSNLFWISEGRVILGRYRRRWEDNIEMDFKEIVCDGMDCIQLTQESGQWRSHMNTEINFRVSNIAGSFLISWMVVSFRRTLVKRVYVLGTRVCVYSVILSPQKLQKTRDSSVGMALSYGLDDRGSRVRFPAGNGNFSLHHHV
jgi:hypothetical protein